MQIFSILLLATFTTSVLSVLLPCRNHNQISEFLPKVSELTGDYGYIKRFSGKSIKSLCTIYYPPGLAGKTCKLVFQNPLWASGSQIAQVFTLGSPNIKNATWEFLGEAAFDQYIGMFFFERTSDPWGQATFIDGGKFPCPGTAGARGYAIAPTFDDVFISWVLQRGGLKVKY